MHEREAPEKRRSLSANVSVRGAVRVPSPRASARVSMTPAAQPQRRVGAADAAMQSGRRRSSTTAPQTFSAKRQPASAAGDVASRRSFSAAKQALPQGARQADEALDPTMAAAAPRGEHCRGAAQGWKARREGHDAGAAVRGPTAHVSPRRVHTALHPSPLPYPRAWEPQPACNDAGRSPPPARSGTGASEEWAARKDMLMAHRATAGTAGRSMPVSPRVSPRAAPAGDPSKQQGHPTTVSPARRVVRVADAVDVDARLSSRSNEATRRSRTVPSPTGGLVPRRQMLLPSPRERATAAEQHPQAVAGGAVSAGALLADAARRSSSSPSAAVVVPGLRNLSALRSTFDDAYDDDVCDTCAPPATVFDLRRSAPGRDVPTADPRPSAPRPSPRPSASVPDNALRRVQTLDVAKVVSFADGPVPGFTRAPRHTSLSPTRRSGNAVAAETTLAWAEAADAQNTSVLVTPNVSPRAAQPVHMQRHPVNVSATTWTHPRPVDSVGDGQRSPRVTAARRTSTHQRSDDAQGSALLSVGSTASSAASRVGGSTPRVGFGTFRVLAPHGVALRNSMNLPDRSTKLHGPPKGSVLTATIMSGTWLRLSSCAFLPLEVDGTQLLEAVGERLPTDKIWSLAKAVPMSHSTAAVSTPRPSQSLATPRPKTKRARGTASKDTHDTTHKAGITPRPHSQKTDARKSTTADSDTYSRRSARTQSHTHPQPTARAAKKAHHDKQERERERREREVEKLERRELVSVPTNPLGTLSPRHAQAAAAEAPHTMSSAPLASFGSASDSLEVATTVYVPRAMVPLPTDGAAGMQRCGSASVYSAASGGHVHNSGSERLSPASTAGVPPARVLCAAVCPPPPTAEPTGRLSAASAGGAGGGRTFFRTLSMVRSSTEERAAGSVTGSSGARAAPVAPTQPPAQSEHVAASGSQGPTPCEAQHPADDSRTRSVHSSSPHIVSAAVVVVGQGATEAAVAEPVVSATPGKSAGTPVRAAAIESRGAACPLVIQTDIDESRIISASAASASSSAGLSSLHSTETVKSAREKLRRAERALQCLNTDDASSLLEIKEALLTAHQQLAECMSSIPVQSPQSAPLSFSTSPTGTSVSATQSDACEKHTSRRVSNFGPHSMLRTDPPPPQLAREMVAVKDTMPMRTAPEQTCESSVPSQAVECEVLQCSTPGAAPLHHDSQRMLFVDDANGIPSYTGFCEEADPSKTGTVQRLAEVMTTPPHAPTAEPGSTGRTRPSPVTPVRQSSSGPSSPCPVACTRVPHPHPYQPMCPLPTTPPSTRSGATSTSRKVVKRTKKARQASKKDRKHDDPSHFDVSMMSLESAPQTHSPPPKEVPQEF